MGRLSMYKVAGGGSVPIFNGQPNTVQNSFSSVQVPSSDLLHVERASLVYDWAEAGILSIGRQNTSDGPPLEVRAGTEREASPRPSWSTRKWTASAGSSTSTSWGCRSTASLASATVSATTPGSRRRPGGEQFHHGRLQLLYRHAAGGGHHRAQGHHRPGRMLDLPLLVEGWARCTP